MKEKKRKKKLTYPNNAPHLGPFSTFLNLSIKVSSSKKQGKNSLQAQTTCLVSFGPVLTIAILTLSVTLK
jgi:hypothetical protein